LNLKDLEAHGHDTKVKKVDRISPTQVRLTVELPGDTVKKHESATVQRFSMAARIPGFRPGKAPLKLVRDRFGEDIRKEVLSHLVESGVSEAIQSTKLMPVSQPRIQLKDVTFGEGKAIEFDVEFEVQPEIEVRNYKKIPVKAAETAVSDEEVDKTVQGLRDRMAALEPLESTKPEKGNFAVVEIGFEIKSEPPRKEPVKSYTLEVGTGQLLPELDAALADMAVNDQKTVSAKFPDDYHDKDLAGKDAVYEVKLLELKKKTLPEVNDAFAAQLREGFTLDGLLAEIRQNLESTKKEEAERSRRKEILDYLVANNTFDVPNSLIENQMARLVQWMEDDMKSRGYAPMQLKQEDFVSLRRRAEDMVRGGLLLKEIAVKEKIELDETALEKRIENVAAQLNRSIDETRKWLSGKGMMERLQDEVLTDQVYEFLISNAQAGTAGST
jgi:trigger factor